MGKASNAKRARREQQPVAPQPQPPRRNVPVFWIVVALVVLGAVGAMYATRDTNDGGSSGAATDAPVYQDVIVTGDALPGAASAGRESDPAVGDTIPTTAGTTLDGSELTIGPDAGPAVIAVMAHWCPHCQEEIPRVAEHLEETPLPDGVSLFGISTSAGDDRPNFPPQEWLDEAGWDAPTLADDEIGSAAEALGTESFPYFVFVDGEGKVASRVVGEIDLDEFDAHVREIAGGDE